MTQSAGQRRGFAILSLASGALGVVIAIVSAGKQFPVGLIALVLLLVAAGPVSYTHLTLPTNREV